jgi:hypothetical protein
MTSEEMGYQKYFDKWKEQEWLPQSIDDGIISE